MDQSVVEHWATELPNLTLMRSSKCTISIVQKLPMVKSLEGSLDRSRQQQICSLW